MKPINFAKDWKYVFFLIVSLLMQGCADDNLSDCGVKIRFQYVKNQTRTDKLETDISKLDMFVFDAKGVFIGEYVSQGTLRNGYTTDLPLVSGKYSIVVWGNPDSDYELPSVVRGQTNINEASLSLKCTGNTVTTLPASLFYGSLLNMDFQADNRRSHIYTVDMTKNTKSITVTVKGLVGANDKYDIVIQSKSASLKFVDNRIASANILRYVPQSRVDDQGWWISDFVVMRELEDESTESRLTITDIESSRKLFDENLTKMLMSRITLADFEVTDHFDIVIEYDNTMTANIRINGWEYTETTQGV
jgi:hypothetical protein